MARVEKAVACLAAKKAAQPAAQVPQVETAQVIFIPRPLGAVTALNTYTHKLSK